MGNDISNDNIINFGEYDTETLARWMNTLNNWTWPDDMPGKPSGFDGLPSIYRLSDLRRDVKPCKYTVITPYMLAIGANIGHKEFLRWHHIHNMERTNLQFEWWWIGREFLSVRLWIVEKLNRLCSNSAKFAG